MEKNDRKVIKLESRETRKGRERNLSRERILGKEKKFWKERKKSGKEMGKQVFIYFLKLH